ncbi:hypothetical protein CSW60_20225 [Caulobacter sp. X]|nr:hypothetical protein CSW60_20225 [Caulobacter sp. X]
MRGSLPLPGGEGDVSDEHSRLLIHPLRNRLILSPPRSTGEGARPATFAALGGGRAGPGSRGILERSGDLVAGQTRAVGVVEGKRACLAVSPSSSTAGASGNGAPRVPVRPEQGHPTGRWRITIARGVGLRRNGTYYSHSGRMSGASHPSPLLAFPRQADFARPPP